MVSLTTAVEIRNAGAVSRLGFALSARAFPEATRLASQDSLSDLVEAMEAELTTAPPVHGIPYGEFPWETDRQKRAFFATQGFGNPSGIPTVRTQVFETAWDVEAVYVSDGVPLQIQVVNPTLYRKYVTGRRQQRFHRLIGWPNEFELYARYRKLLLDRFVAEFPRRLKERLLRRR